jgi:hypothetical protein
MANRAGSTKRLLEEFVLTVLPEAPDFRFENHGSLCLLRPLTDAGREWVYEHIGPDNGCQPYYPTVVIEPRYCEAILEGAAAEGLRLS